MNDSYKVIPAALLPIPGKCFKCGSNQRDCVDLGFDAEFYGAVMLCLDCAHSLVDVPELGFRTEKSVAALEAELARLRHIEATLNRAKVAFNNAVLGAIDIFDDVFAEPAPEPVPDVEAPANSVEDFFGAFSKGS